MNDIKTAHINILESSTVSLTAGTADASYPLYRLYDRNVGRYFKTTAAVTTTVHIDQGGSPIDLDRLLIPTGHNLSGMTLDIEWSTDNNSWTPAVTQWAGTAGVIDKSWTAVAKRYWRFTVTSPASIPAIPEIFLTSTYTWDRQPERPGPALDPAYNVATLRSANGHISTVTMGESKRTRSYTIANIGETQKTALLALDETHAGGAKPFWLYDHTGAWIYGRLTSAIGIREIQYQRYSAIFEFEEIIP